MGRQIYGCRDRWMDGRIGSYIVGRQMDGGICRWMDRWREGWRDEGWMER